MNIVGPGFTFSCPLCLHFSWRLICYYFIRKYNSREAVVWKNACEASMKESQLSSWLLGISITDYFTLSQVWFNKRLQKYLCLGTVLPGERKRRIHLPLFSWIKGLSHIDNSPWTSRLYTCITEQAHVISSFSINREDLEHKEKDRYTVQCCQIVATWGWSEST